MSTYFYILPPLQIPTPGMVQSTLGAAQFSELTNAGLKGSWSSNLEGAKALSALLANLPGQLSANGRPRNLDFKVASGASRDDNAHDDYFLIRRLGGPAAELYIRTILSANLLLLEDSWDSPFTIAADKINLLDRAFGALLSWTLGEVSPAEHPIAPRIAHWKSRGGGSYQSMSRWIRGHQIFAALTQGLTATFRDLKSALQRMDDQCISKTVDLAVLLLHGSAASLEFTGDFPPQDYAKIIRPSMTPPLVPDTFSGLLSVDHRFFIQSLREMKPLLDALAEYPASHHQQITSAVAAVYDSHRFVCDRLVGKSPSLMMASGSKKSGAEQIEKFKHLRLRVFEPDKPTGVTEGSPSSQRTTLLKQKN